MQPGITRPARSGQTNRSAYRAPQQRPSQQRLPQQRRPAGRSVSARPAPVRSAPQGARSRAPQRAPQPNARRPQGAGSGRKGKNPRRRIIIIAALVIIVALLWYALDTLITLGVGTPRFYNVYVNGVSLRGYTREEGFAMFAEFEENWKTRAYELYFGDLSWTFSPATVNAQLNEETVLERAWNYGRVGSISYRKRQIKALNRDGYRFESDITYDETMLENFLSGIRDAINTDPVDAVIAAEVDGPRVITESSVGYQLEEEETRALLRDLLIYGSEEARVELPVIVTEPNVTTEEAQATLGSGEVVGECTTSIESSTSNRKTNVRVALSRFNGLRVNPGETVSFNAVALERTLGNGYKEGIEYSEGESTTGIGGGTCQASTTLYGALLQAGVTIVERHNHSMTVGYVEPSLDASVTDTGSKDLVFRNDSDLPIYIYTTVTDTTATVRIYGEKPPYRYVFRSIVIEDEIQPTEETVRTDTEGRYATYTDEKVLVTEGKTGMRSQLWRDSFDWETNEFVETVQISSDYYTPGRNIYYVGVQPRYAPTPSNPTTGNW